MLPFSYSTTRSEPHGVTPFFLLEQLTRGFYGGAESLLATTPHHLPACTPTRLPSLSTNTPM